MPLMSYRFISVSKTYLTFFQKRAIQRTQEYFYHPISDTPFSLGIALPQDRKHRVEGEIDVSSAKINSKY